MVRPAAEGARLACTTTLSVALPVPPLPSDAVTVTVRVAGARNAFVGFCSVDVVPSPKSHAYVTASPSGSVALAVNEIGTPTRTMPVGGRAAVTLGFWFGSWAEAVAGSAHVAATSAHTILVRRIPSPSG